VYNDQLYSETDEQPTSDGADHENVGVVSFVAELFDGDRPVGALGPCWSNVIF